MTPLWQVSRNGAFWLLASVLVSTLPLMRHLPVWVFGVVGTALLWRFGIFRGRLGSPGRWLKWTLVLTCAIGVQVSFGRIYGLEPMASLLVSGFSLKLLEMHHARDAFLVIFLGYFVAIILALFDQGMLTGLIICFSLLMVTASLVSLHQGQGSRVRLSSLGAAGKLLAQAFPLMLLFFIVMPRLGPLWSVPDAKSGITGMSDSLSIGDIAQLGRSSELAFRVNFDGEPPPREQLYWRGMTLSSFNGKTWSRSGWGYRGGLVNWVGEPRASWRDQTELGAEPISYSVILEKQRGNWLYALWLPEPKTVGTGLARDFTLVSLAPPTGRYEYDVFSYPRARAESVDLDPVRRQVETHLPHGGNPQARLMAGTWISESADPMVFIERVLGLYRDSFSYTLRPPLLGEHSVDDFLFSSRQGFCEHFAASFVFLMRAAGIPARIVVGYQGGEFHPDEGYLTVRQYDAHAWAEVWLDGRGWTQFDPTAAVAPERILFSFFDLMAEDENLQGAEQGLGRFRAINWINGLRLKLDALEYHWGRWVLGYDNVQGELLSKLLGGLDSWRIGLFVLVGFAVALVPVLLYGLLSRPRTTRPEVDSLYLIFCNRMARAGCLRAAGEAPSAFAGRCVEKFPAFREPVERITRQYLDIKYGEKGELTEFRKQVRLFRPFDQKHRSKR